MLYFGLVPPSGLSSLHPLKVITPIIRLRAINKNGFSLIDEPTNHLDEDSRMQVIAYLQQHSNGYIVVSHDRAFLNQVTNHILAIENTEIHLYQGNFASYEDTKAKRDKFNQDKLRYFHVKNHSILYIHLFLLTIFFFSCTEYNGVYLFSMRKKGEQESVAAVNYYSRTTRFR